MSEEIDFSPINIDEFFKPQGKLATLIKGYHERPEQTMMAGIINEALADNRHCLAEAGTGVGKSISYLVPSIAWALEHDTRVLVSTHTKALQMQLIRHELPRLADESCFGTAVKYEMCVGAENYICLLRLIRLANDRQGLGLDQAATTALADVLAWSRGEVSGLRQDMEVVIPDWLWQKIHIIRETCINRHCPYFEDCFLQLARKRQRQAQVLVTNHSLFLANVMTEGSLIPEFGAAILDEAHKIEDVATQFFGDECAQSVLSGLLQDIIQHGRGNFLKQIRGLSHGVIDRLADEARVVLEKTDSWWQAVLEILPLGQESIRYTDKVVINHEPPVEILVQLANDVNDLAEAAETEEDAKAISLMAAKLKHAAMTMDDWMLRDTPDMVYWAERYYYQKSMQVRILATPLDLSEKFKTLVLDVIPSVTFVSATIAVNGQFQYIRNRLGIYEALEIILESPFPYEEHAAIYLPDNMPEPNAGQDYEQALEREMLALIKSFYGGVFLLFTNYKLMKQMATSIRAQQDEFDILVQGEAPPHQLIKMFQKSKHAVMMGVETFWQGVDVPGEALRCVIISRLPFDVPTHPVYESRAEYLEAHGQNPFVSYALPRAMLMLRQGFGRLIRHHNDRGVVAILDSRVRTRSWGRRFVTMLPKCAILHTGTAIDMFVDTHFPQINRMTIDGTTKEN